MRLGPLEFNLKREKWYVEPDPFGLDDWHGHGRRWTLTYFRGKRSRTLDG